MANPIYVTQPSLPPLEEFNVYLRQIWKNKILTNQGPLHEQLESELCKFLGVKYITLFNNGMTALICAMRALDISQEVITTPYSFIATTHALLWNNLTPVFVDIDPFTLNIDPQKIESAITKKTTAILPVHCYGQSCDVTYIKKIADKYSLKVIYDAAHAFGVRDEEGSILNYGDLSVLSFHATKVFNTFEGGAVVCHDQSMKLKLDLLKNFGIVDEVTIPEMGLNGKMSEINAAMGLAQLKYLPETINARQQVDAYYRDSLGNIPGITLLLNSVKDSKKTQFNYSYFPILIGDDYPLSRDELYFHLKSHGIYARRYFYPLISNCPVYSGFPSAEKLDLRVANNVSNTVICLPIYPALDFSSVDYVIKTIKNVF